jgi:hypothetical protein
MIRAQLTFTVPSHRMADSLIKAVEPDNREMAGLKIVGTAARSYVVFELQYGGGVETFISTLDDMLRCLQVARETLDTVSGRKLE